MQLRLAIKTRNTLKEREYHWRSAEAFDRLGEFTDAEEQLKALQDMELTKEQYLETLCHLADIQVPASTLPNITGWSSTSINISSISVSQCPKLALLQALSSLSCGFATYTSDYLASCHTVCSVFDP